MGRVIVSPDFAEADVAAAVEILLARWRAPQIQQDREVFGAPDRSSLPAGYVTGVVRRDGCSRGSRAELVR
jgi:hypothetical protein